MRNTVGYSFQLMGNIVYKRLLSNTFGYYYKIQFATYGKYR
jgi:hypothetical protein